MSVPTLTPTPKPFREAIAFHRRRGDRIMTPLINSAAWHNALAMQQIDPRVTRIDDVFAFSIDSLSALQRDAHLSEEFAALPFMIERQVAERLGRVLRKEADELELLETPIHESILTGGVGV